jgi:hypothetical protein
MTYRKLRIAWSVAWGVAAVLLCVMWVRSYWWADCIDVPVPANKTMIVALVPGGVGIQHHDNSAIFRPLAPWKLVSRSPQRDWKVHSKLGLFYDYHPQHVTVECAYWVLLVGITAAGTVSWLPIRRFSLRTLLNATTLVAAVMRLIAWLLNR